MLLLPCRMWMGTSPQLTTQTVVRPVSIWLEWTPLQAWRIFRQWTSKPGIWRHQFLCTQQHYEFACRLSRHSPINDDCNAWLLDTCWRASHDICTAGISICSRASTSVPKVICVMSSSVRYWRAPNICWEVWGGISVTIWIHIIWCTWAFHTKALESSSDSTLNAHNVKCCCHITTTSCVPHQEPSKAIPDSAMVYALQSPS